ncbi:MAG TPA: hydantoinase/oxoprolinase family protein [Gemmatimonadaceae bacterium]|nr:hydantoinase/oxoprolinase family protein [Gemmatimonadaceae bacterium]
MTGIAVGIDVGGTFTDLVAIAADGGVRATKVLSTPDDQSAGVAEALDAAALPVDQVQRLVHGTTVATNTLLERSGARVVLCATAGATDLLELRRQDRAALYDLAREHPAPLVAASDVIPVDERVAPEGVVRALDVAAVRETVARVESLRPETIAVSFLHAYRDPSHERTIARALAERLPDIDVVVGSEVLPEIREYERTATVVAEAYLRPRVARYLRRLAQRLRELGFPALEVMTSGGGVRRADEAARGAAALALSGPAGGVVGAARVASAAGFARALTIDIGGTSADVGLILDGAPLIEAGGDVAGVPIALPRVLVETVSAGGGSLLWVDDGGALRAGPRSAGVSPGPAAFGRGGTDATVTDAHLVLGHLGHGAWSGGVRLDGDAAGEAMRRVAGRLGRSLDQTAEAAIAAADAAMARALRRVSVERGIDPRSCVLVAFGGGGPLHACGLADRLQMTRVLVPPFAGVLSALGLALSAERRESMRSVMRSASELDSGAVASLADALAADAGDPRGGAASRQWWMRSRYAGQGHEMEVPFAPGDDGQVVMQRFAGLHARRVGFALDRAVEVVSARHAATGAARDIVLQRRAAPAWRDDRREDDGSITDAVVRGPAVVALPDATLRVAAGWTARALPIGGWMVERDA